MKIHFAFISLALFVFANAAAQQKNTSLHIFYVPGIAEIYGRSYDGEAGMPIQLASLEHYIYYKPVAENMGNLPGKDTLVYNYKFDFDAIGQGFYFLVLNDDKYGVGIDEYPLHRLWLGKGSHQLDMYSVIEDINGLKDKYPSAYKDNHRIYYKGIYEKENRFLDQYSKSAISVEKVLYRYVQERYTNYYDTAEADTKKRSIELSRQYIAMKDSLFKAIDSLAGQLDISYKRDLLSGNAEFDKVMQPEMRSIKLFQQMSYCTYYLSAFANLQTPDKDRVIAMAAAIRKEADALRLPLSCEAYRNASFGYVNAVMNAARDTTAYPSYNQTYHQMITEVIDREYAGQPEMAEYLTASSVGFITKYMSFDSTAFARNAFEQFKNQYPSSLYTATLEMELKSKEDKFRKKLDADIAAGIYNSSTATDSVKETIAETVSVTATAIDALSAFTPPRLLNESSGKPAKCWGLNLFTAANKTVQLKNLKGKNIAVKAMSELPVSRDLAYYQFLEKKFPAITFVYIFCSAPDLSAQKLLQSFGIKGRCLFLRSKGQDCATATETEWYDSIYFPYWQFINSGGLLMHTYQLDNVEDLMKELMQHKPFTDPATKDAKAKNKN